MKKGNCILILILFLLCSVYGENYLKFTINATLLVFDPETTQDAMAAWLDTNRGYYLVKADERMAMRFPADKVGDFTALLETLGENIQFIDQQAVDMREDILAAKSGIKSREDILTRNLKLFDKADVKGTLEIEKEVIILVEEIEGLKGRLNKLETDTTYAYADVAFSFKKSTLPENIPSSFSWLNTLDLYDFVQEGLY